MAKEYIEREAALCFMNAQREQIKKQMDEALAYEHFHTRSDLKCALSQLEDDICLIESISSADVAPVVFCKDCKSCNTDIAVGGWYGMCAFWNGHSVMADDYCSRFRHKDSADMREAQDA